MFEDEDASALAELAASPLTADLAPLQQPPFDSPWAGADLNLLLNVLRGRASQERRESRGALAAQAAAASSAGHGSIDKVRIQWTKGLHNRFLSCVDRLGSSDQATPKAIMKLMAGAGVTLTQVKSHLQRHRNVQNTNCALALPGTPPSSDADLAPTPASEAPRQLQCCEQKQALGTADSPFTANAVTPAGSTHATHAEDGHLPIDNPAATHTPSMMHGHSRWSGFPPAPPCLQYGTTGLQYGTAGLDRAPSPYPTPLPCLPSAQLKAWGPHGLGGAPGTPQLGALTEDLLAQALARSVSLKQQLTGLRQACDRLEQGAVEQGLYLDHLLEQHRASAGVRLPSSSGSAGDGSDEALPKLQAATRTPEHSSCDGSRTDDSSTLLLLRLPSFEFGASAPWGGDGSDTSMCMGEDYELLEQDVLECGLFLDQLVAPALMAEQPRASWPWVAGSGTCGGRGGYAGALEQPAGATAAFPAAFALPLSKGFSN